MFVRAYLRASTSEQDATRARAVLDVFAAERGLTIAASYVENESGAKLARPELFRLLSDCRPGDVLLIEQVDRLSRLTAGDWAKLRTEIDARQLRIVALDLPTSWMLAAPVDEFTGRMFAAINGMLLDVLAAVARKDFDDRKRRHGRGTGQGEGRGRLQGPEGRHGPERWDRRMLAAGRSYSQIQAATGCSRATVAKIREAGSAGRLTRDVLNISERRSYCSVIRIQHLHRETNVNSIARSIKMLLSVNAILLP